MRTVVVRAGHAKPLWSGHPWVHAAAVRRIEGEAEAGAEDVALVQDDQGRTIGWGFVSETSALGAAISAAVGLGYYPDHPAAVEAMTSIRQVVQPIPKNRDLYAHLYDRIYRKMYAQLKPLYEDLADITASFPEAMRP